MSLRPRSFAANNLSEPWKLACLNAMGLDEWLVVDRDDDGGVDSSKAREGLQIMNLHQWETDDIYNDCGDDKSELDPWMETVIQIQANIREMMAWVRQKQREYVSLDIAEGEASLIQTTVTSFAATTANEIESLHQCMTSGKIAQKHQHCAGIVQILMTELKEGIAEPFGQLSKQRSRAAVQLWQKPLQCRLWVPRRRIPTSLNKENDVTLDLLGLDDNDDDVDAEKSSAIDQRFQATRPSHRLHSDFVQSYDVNHRRNERPEFLSRLDAISGAGVGGGGGEKFETVTPKPSVTQTGARIDRQDQYSMDGDDVDDNRVTAAALQQEAVLLQAKTHSDLDSVQKMEQTMMNITALLAQFADLVSEQQEDVWEIHDATVSTKENLQKGQENLHDAKERTAASKHYMATGITAMGFLLLLFHWLRS